MQTRVQLLGIPLDPVTKQEAIDCILGFLQKETFHHVMTPNSEMLAATRNASGFKNLLSRTDLNLPDSAGLLVMAKCTGQTLPERVTGVDTVTALCNELDADHSVFLLGAAPGIAERAAEALHNANPALHIAGVYAGSPSPEEAPGIIERINASGAHILLVAYGAPQQDLWIDEHRDELKTVRVAMGVGGTFDFLAGTVKRAPRLFQTLGCEWLWRLILQPSRWKRIWNAVVVFPFLVLCDSFKSRR